MNKSCLRRLVSGSSRVFGNYMKTNNSRYVVSPHYHYIYTKTSSITQTTTAKSFTSLSSLESHDSHPEGSAYHELVKTPTSIHSQLVESGGCGVDIDVLAGDQEMHIIKKGDTVNLSQLLFTKNRDYLIRYNDPQRVTADQLSNKVVLLYFLDRNPCYFDMTIASLIDVYNELKHKNCFEVVVVFIDDVLVECGEEVADQNSSSQTKSQTFDKIFSCMPWTAIPFSDVISRKYLTIRFGLPPNRWWNGARTFAIDPTGLIVSTGAQYEINRYGSLAFPFTKERIATLESEFDAISRQPSLKTLLVTPERDYVISNKGEKIPIQTLEDKVVALLFYEDDMEHPYPLEKLRRAYHDVRKNNENFEVVLVYLTNTLVTCNYNKHTNKETYWNTFETMPWLALPFKDPIHKKLERLFRYPPDNGYEGDYVPNLVILGPHADYIEPCGAEILSHFGVSSYPFTRENLVRLDTEKVKELKLENMCSPTTLFMRRDGFQVEFSQLLGKRVILYFEKWGTFMRDSDLVQGLKEMYLRVKGTDDEFEVIYFPYANDKSCYDELLGDVSWFVLSPDHHSVFLPGASAAFTILGQLYTIWHRPLLLAFGEDGKLVRRSLNPRVEQEEGFPFYAAGTSMEMEAFEFLTYTLIDGSYYGLLRNSYEKEKGKYLLQKEKVL